MANENFDFAGQKESFSTKDAFVSEQFLQVLGTNSAEQKAIMQDMRKPAAGADFLPDLKFEGLESNDLGGGGQRTHAAERYVAPAKAEAVDVNAQFSQTVDDNLVDAGRLKVVKENGRWSTDVGVMSDPEKFEQWLNTSIPKDGTRATDDRRTELVIKTALANSAMNENNSASMQVTEAYVMLNGLRHMMRASGNSFSSDPGLANAEHFFETAHRVAGQPFDGTATDLTGQVLRGAWTAPIWEGLSAGYNTLKQSGILGGSDAENQHKWESAGIDYGVRVYDASQK